MNDRQHEWRRSPSRARYEEVMTEQPSGVVELTQYKKARGLTALPAFSDVTEMLFETAECCYHSRDMLRYAERKRGMIEAEIRSFMSGKKILYRLRGREFATGSSGKEPMRDNSLPLCERYAAAARYQAAHFYAALQPSRYL